MPALLDGLGYMMLGLLTGAAGAGIVRGLQTFTGWRRYRRAQRWAKRYDRWLEVQTAARINGTADRHPYTRESGPL